MKNTALSLKILLLLACGILSACQKQPDEVAESEANRNDPNSLTVLVGSELKDFGPKMTEAAQSVGVKVHFSYAGTLDIVDRINSGEKFDAILPPNSAYPSLALTQKPVASEKLFYSRIAIGVKQSIVQQLGWNKKNPSWADIADAASQGKLKYAMTNPTSSNSGMSALFAVAAAGAGKTEDITEDEVNTKLLTLFLKGQQLTAGSSGWLADAFVNSGNKLDAMINYEAVLLRANERLSGPNKLMIIYPTDGVITANYPLMLINGGKKPLFDKLVANWKSDSLQTIATNQMYLRPVSSHVKAASILPASPVVDLAFPSQLAVIDKVLSAYQGELRRPATSIFVLDISGSMGDDNRMDDVKKALKILTGSDSTSATARYTRFQNREKVQLLAFDNEVRPVQTINFDKQLEVARAKVNQFADTLEPTGGTAIYTALAAAEKLAKTEATNHPERLVSIVLLTDGENTSGLSSGEFEQTLKAISGVKNKADVASTTPARIFPIIFGDASDTELEEIAALTGGKLFDARKTALPIVFKEIRSYQ